MIWKRPKQLPVYSEKAYTDHFRIAFGGGGNLSSITCICGRTHFSDQFPIEDDGDEQEKQRLESSAMENPHVFIVHTEYIDHFSSDGKSVVFDCPCNYAGFLEAKILEHRRSIIDYLKYVSLRVKSDADTFRENVLSIEK